MRCSVVVVEFLHFSAERCTWGAAESKSTKQGTLFKAHFKPYICIIEGGGCPRFSKRPQNNVWYTGCLGHTNKTAVLLNFRTSDASNILRV